MYDLSFILIVGMTIIDIILSIIVSITLSARHQKREQAINYKKRLVLSSILGVCIFIMALILSIFLPMVANIICIGYAIYEIFIFTLGIKAIKISKETDIERNERFINEDLDSAFLYPRYESSESKKQTGISFDEITYKDNVTYSEEEKIKKSGMRAEYLTSVAIDRIPGEKEVLYDVHIPELECDDPYLDTAFQEIDALCFVGNSIYIIETKSWSGNVTVNANLPVVFHEDEEKKSPVQQNHRHYLALFNYVKRHGPKNVNYYMISVLGRNVTINYVNNSSERDIRYNNLPSDEICSIEYFCDLCSNIRQEPMTYEVRSIFEEIKNDPYNERNAKASAMDRRNLESAIGKNDDWKCETYYIGDKCFNTNHARTGRAVYRCTGWNFQNNNGVIYSENGYWEQLFLDNENNPIDTNSYVWYAFYVDSPESFVRNNNLHAVKSSDINTRFNELKLEEDELMRRNGKFSSDREADW